MAIPYVLHEKAHEEYLDAYEWYEIRKKGLGDRFMNCVEKRLQQISEHPEFYGKIQDNFREAKVEGFPFTIVYEYFKRRKIIHIAAIHHIKRNPRQKRRRMN